MRRITSAIALVAWYDYHLCCKLCENDDIASITVVFRIVTPIVAPIELCFDLARDIDFHVHTLESTGEKAVAGRVTGLIELGESVTWEARHLFVRQRLTSRITQFDRPVYFRDEMTAGAFQSFAHDHRFETRGDETIMTDEIAFRSPFGPVGWLVDSLFMTGYLRRLLAGRCRAIKREAERRTKQGAHWHRTE